MFLKINIPIPTTKQRESKLPPESIPAPKKTLAWLARGGEECPRNKTPDRLIAGNLKKSLLLLCVTSIEIAAAAGREKMGLRGVRSSRKRTLRQG